MILEMGCAVRDEPAIDSDAIRCNLHVVARDSGDWLHQRCPPIGTRTSWRTVAPLERDDRCIALGAKLDEVR